MSSNTESSSCAGNDPVIDHDDPTECQARQKAEEILLAVKQQQGDGSSNDGEVEDDDANGNRSDILERAQELKQQGNKYFNEKEWEEAIKYYTLAIDIHPEESTYYSNRSVCYVQLKLYTEALHDAIVAQTLNPTWSKAYYRIAMSRYELKKYKLAALAAYQGLYYLQHQQQHQQHKGKSPTNSTTDKKSREELKRILRTCAQHARQEYQQKKKNMTSETSTEAQNDDP